MAHLLVNISLRIQGWRYGSTVKDTYGAHRRNGLSYQNPQGDNYPVPGFLNPIHLLTSMGTAHTWCTDKHAGKTAKHINKNKYILKDD